MDFEFDKEMDALLRQAAQGETVSVNPKSEIRNPKSHHLDADQIAAFAENSLPEKTKAFYTAHFADCGRCRTILSRVILLNRENPSETVHAPQKTLTVAVVLPWYKRLFAAPSLAYAMGALVLVFGAVIAYTVFRSANMPQNSEISQIEPAEKMSGPNAGDQAQITEPSASALSNGGSTASSAMSSAASGMSGSAMTNAATPASSSGGSMSNGATAANSAAVSNTQIETKTGSTAGASGSGETGISNADLARPTKPKAAEAKNRTEEDNDMVLMQMPVASAPSPPMVGSSAPAAENSAKARSANDLNEQDAKKAKSDRAETRQTGGKTFKRENGAWYDRSYKGQATTNIARGSEDFKKLDAGLRSIAGNLSGTVVVVYNGKAYRIQ